MSKLLASTRNAILTWNISVCTGPNTKLKPTKWQVIGNPTFLTSIKGDFNIQQRPKQSKNILRLVLWSSSYHHSECCHSWGAERWVAVFFLVDHSVQRYDPIWGDWLAPVQPHRVRAGGLCPRGSHAPRGSLQGLGWSPQAVHRPHGILRSGTVLIECERLESVRCINEFQRSFSPDEQKQLFLTAHWTSGIKSKAGSKLKLESTFCSPIIVDPKVPSSTCISEKYRNYFTLHYKHARNWLPIFAS